MIKRKNTRLKMSLQMLLLAIPLTATNAQSPQENNLKEDKESKQVKFEAKQSNGAERTHSREMFKRDSVSNRTAAEKATIARITEELQNDLALPTKSKDEVTFRTSNGKIIVSGTVQSQDDMERILLISRSHANLNPVVNDLKVITK